MSKIHEILKFLSNRDVDALKSIYDYRCLTTQQLYKLHYMYSTKEEGKIVSDNYCKRKLSELVELDILTEKEHPKDNVYFLTTQGINIIRYSFDLPTNIFDYEKSVVERGYYRAFELEVSPRYLDHQLSLNDFIIDFILEKHDVYWKYLDEKHISDFRNIRPDGLLRMIDINFFLEMDMATESKGQLYEKWDNYRRFLDSQEFLDLERKVVVLFIVENTANPQARIDLIKHTLDGRLMDKIDNNFEIYVGTSEDLLGLLSRFINSSNGNIKNISDEIFNTLANQGFSVGLGENLKKIFKGVEYEFYARKIDENNKIKIKNGKIQEFLVDNYYSEPFSVLKKIAFLNISNVYFKERAGRKISYLVVAESIEKLYRDLKIMDLVVVDEVYYTTLKRLKEKPFYEALFQFDFLGNVHSFKNEGFKDRNFEFNMSEIIKEDL
jgi:hypothetical protein